jgi:Fe-S cluster assembly ATP-binding protein
MRSSRSRRQRPSRDAVKFLNEIKHVIDRVDAQRLVGLRIGLIHGSDHVTPDAIDQETMMLSVKGLKANVGENEILTGLDIEVGPGEIHAIMGPNGSGKSTFSHVLSGREGYEVTAGSVTFEGQDLLALEPEERAHLGVFLAFQYPVELPGVNNTYFLKAALNSIRKSRGEERAGRGVFLRLIKEKLKILHLDDSLLKRAVNAGFSGGEKKRNEIFQMALLEPKLAILDETDSGLDIDALRVVADGVNALRSPERSMIVVTHYQRLLDYIEPDYVHVLAKGRIIRSGGKELASSSKRRDTAGFSSREQAA